MSGYKNYQTTTPRSTVRITPSKRVVHGAYSDREAMGCHGANCNCVACAGMKAKSNSGLNGGAAYVGKLF